MLDTRMSVTSMTIAKAPRTKEGLLHVGIFNVRLLTEQLGALHTYAQKKAFACSSGEEKLELLFVLLTEHDQGGGPVTARIKKETEQQLALEAEQNATREAEIRAMKAHVMIVAAAKESGWNKDSMISLLCEYIDEQHSNDLLERFLQDKLDADG